MSNQFKFNDLQNNLNTKTVNPEKNIIQCTFCHTKYSLGAESISSLSEPKFHCFKCDNVFSVSVNKKVETDSGTQDENLPQMNEQNWNSGFGSNLKIKSALLSNNTSMLFEQPKNFETQSNSKDKLDSNFDFSFGLKNSDKTNNQFSFNFEEKTKFEQPTAQLEGKDRFSFSGIRQSATSDQAKSPHITNPFLFIDSENANKKPKKSEKFTFQVPKFNIPKFSLGIEKTLKEKTVVSNFPENKIYFENSRKPTYPAFSVLLITILITLIAILGVAYLLENKIIDSQKTLTFINEIDKKIPPQGLGVRDLELRQVTLDNGEVLQVLEGVVYNNSKVQTSKVVLEGLLFNANGDLVVREKVNLASTLEGEVNYSSLSKNILKDISRETNRKIMLNPKDQLQFKIAFLEELPKEVAYYTGRVYSVG